MKEDDMEQLKIGDRVSGTVQGQHFTGEVTRTWERSTRSQAVTIRTDQDLYMSQTKTSNIVVKLAHDVTKID